LLFDAGSPAPVPARAAWRPRATSQSLNRVSSLNHLVGGREQRGRQGEANRFGDFEIDHEFVFGGSINRYVARFGPVEDLVAVIGRASPGFADVGLMGHQPTRLHVISVGIHRWWTVLIDQLDDRLMVGGKVSSAIYHYPDARTRPGLSERSYHLIWSWTKYRSVASDVMASAVPGPVAPREVELEGSGPR